MAKEKQDTENKRFDSALKVNEGVERLPVINEKAISALQLRRRKEPTVDEYVQGILNQDRSILSRAITLVESALPAHYEKAQQIIEKCTPHSSGSFRIGITGVPGVGKSTFIEAFGLHLISKGHKIAVLAVDPSSEISKGSILGDKTRMETLSNHDQAFIRPSPSAGSLGGVARKTREIIILCEAAGYDRILIETVGVGQSETAVHSMADFFLLLMLAGAGDELQGIKRGIMEMCDGMVINKADGDNLIKAQTARVQYQNAFHLFPQPSSGWPPKVEICSALKKTGIGNVYNMIASFEEHVKESGFFQAKRKSQQKHQMYDSIRQYLTDHFNHHKNVGNITPSVLKELEENLLTPYQAANKLLDAYFSDLKH
ncbi:MAG: methylmalonyl Co-A mutase-associated GTPase MeaB [Bacteroidota bacterium]